MLEKNSTNRNYYGEFYSWLFLESNSAASMFNKSMNNPDGKMNKLTEHKLKADIYNSPEMKSAIITCVEKNKNEFKYSCGGDTKFVSNRNLSLSIGKAKYKITGHNNPISGIASLKINVNDIYNFDEKRENNSFSNLANNLGYYYQKNEILKPYYWEINYYVNLPYQK